MKTTLVIFGITGDLGQRKLLPALATMFRSGAFDELSVLGVSRRQVAPGEVLKNLPEPGLLAGRFDMVEMDLANVEAYRALKQRLAADGNDQTLMYLSVPPDSAEQIMRGLGEAGLNDDTVKLLFEKPFGRDLASAKEVIASASRYFDEQQMYRIDHYAAKAMAQNLLVMRSHDAMLQAVWDRRYIESIDIVAAEALDIEGRVTFYEQAGALRDILQGHLLQLLALVLMDVPNDFSWQDVPRLRLAALEQVVPADPAAAIRAQYEGYRQEVAAPASTTETFASLELHSTDSRWQDVPIRLTTGKALNTKMTQIVIMLKADGVRPAARLTLSIQPDERLTIEWFVKSLGYEQAVTAKELAVSFDEVVMADAYEQVLADAIAGRKSLFTTSAEVLRAWQIVAPVQTAWAEASWPLSFYPKGSTVDTVRADATT